MTSDDAASKPSEAATADFGSAVDEMATTTDRLLASVDAMSRESLREPSLLPGWTRAHVLAHLARGADGLAELVRGAADGTPRPMYAGGKAGRDADIESGAGRDLGDLRLDLAESSERLLAALSEISPEALTTKVVLASGAVVSAHDVPLIRVREVEIHHVDLDVGYSPDDWSPAFAARTLDQISPFFRTARDCPVGSLIADDGTGRWEVAAEGPSLAGSLSELAAWLTGRAPGSGLRVDDAPAGAGVPAAPPWV